MRVYLDTNILLDIIEGREKFVLASSNVFDLGMRGKIQMFATPLSFANCVYSARKTVAKFLERQQGQVSVSPNVGWKRGAFSGLN